MNNITIAGRLGKDSELKQTNSGDPILLFSIADSQGRDEESIWWNCSIFGKRGESLQPYLKKGANITVSGSIKENEYTDKTGVRKKSFSVRVNDVALQSGKRDGDEEQRQPNQRQPEQRQPDPTRRPQPAKQAQPPSGFNDMDDDIPF